MDTCRAVMACRVMGETSQTQPGLFGKSSSLLMLGNARPSAPAPAGLSCGLVARQAPVLGEKTDEPAHFRNLPDWYFFFIQQKEECKHVNFERIKLFYKQRSAKAIWSGSEHHLSPRLISFKEEVSVIDY